MRKIFGLLLTIVFVLAGCMSPNVEDSSVYQPKGFKKYVNPDIYVDDTLISGPESDKEHSASEKKSNGSGNFKSRPANIKDKAVGLEWVSGPDRDTNWQAAKTWVQNLPVDGGDWRMPTIDELKTLHQKGDAYLLSNTTGRWVWSIDAKGPFARLFSFRYGIDKKSRRSESKNYRAFAVRPRKH